MEGHIFIYGIITSVEDKAKEENKKYNTVSPKDVSDQIIANKEADTLIVHINSGGGSVFSGFGIHDILLASGKKVVTIAEGFVASIATVIFLAGSERKITMNTKLMVHNPWGEATGNSDELFDYASRLREEENRIADFYSLKTGLQPDDVRLLMASETYLDADQAIEKGFATEIITQLKAVASLKPIMNIEELNKKVDDGHKSIFDKIMGIFRKQGLIQALVVKTADDQNLDFGEDIKESSEIAVGSPATVDGKPAEGEYTMPDGTVYVFAGGKVTEIKPPAEEEKEDPEAAALKAENENLKAQLTEAQTKATEAQDALKAVKDDLEAFKAQVTSDIQGFKPQPPAQPDGEIVRKPFKSSK